MTPLQALIDARALIAEPERWTQGATAKTKLGNAVIANHELATCWCVMGALTRVSGWCEPDADITLWRAYNDAMAEIGALYRPSAEYPEDHVPSWNDAPERTHAEVLAAFDAAIARLEAQQ